MIELIAAVATGGFLVVVGLCLGANLAQRGVVFPRRSKVALGDE